MKDEIPPEGGTTNGNKEREQKKPGRENPGLRFEMPLQAEAAYL